MDASFQSSNYIRFEVPSIGQCQYSTQSTRYRLNSNSFDFFLLCYAPLLELNRRYFDDSVIVISFIIHARFLFTTRWHSHHATHIL